MVPNLPWDIWGLVALEATLFLSLPCWELTAGSDPITYPLLFAAVVCGTATLAMLLFHVIPARLAAANLQIPRLCFVLLAVWLSIGFLERIFAAARMVADSGAAVGVLPFLLLVLAAVANRLLARVATGAALLLAGGVLAWALAMNWHGLSHQNPHFSAEPRPFDAGFAEGMLLTAVPAVAIAWRLGRHPQGLASLGWTGVLGVWVPLVVSVMAAAIAREAGLALYYRPSLPGGFYWALQSPQGPVPPAEDGAIWTLFGLALVSAGALRDLAPRWRGWQRLYWLPAGALLGSGAMAANTWVPEGLHFQLAMPAYRYWALTIALLCLAGALWLLTSSYSWTKSTK